MDKNLEKYLLSFFQLWNNNPLSLRAQIFHIVNLTKSIQMNRSIFSSKTRRVCFRRWGNKSFSVFASLKLLVKVSVLSASYSLLAMPVEVYAQPDTISLRTNVDIDEVVISTPQAASTYSELMRAVTVVTNDEFSQLPVANLHDLLRNIASVDIRQRGGHQIQADLMVRGGSFDQTLILLNGVNITDPQTGHHNLNIPIDLESVERIELLQGPGARVYGPGSFSGAINIITTAKGKEYARVQAVAGEHGLLRTNASAAFRQGSSNLFVAASSAKSNGYINNTDFSLHNLFAHGQLATSIGSVDVQAGYQDKAFGAQSFYTPKYPDQFEQTGTFFSSVSLNGKTKGIAITPTIYIRSHNDRFELFRNQSPEWYQGHNYHSTISWGGKIAAAALHKHGRTRMGIEFRDEQILSNVLGDPLSTPRAIKGFADTLYTRGHNRSLVNLFVDHTIYLSRLVVSGGGIVTHSNRYGVNWNYGFDLSYRIMRKLSMYASISNAVRFPTFTDLYYSGPTNQGNINLNPEYATSYELGLKLNGAKLTSSIAGFHRRATDVIDWVKAADEEKWRTMNHTHINTTGFDVQAKALNIKAFPLVKSIAASYTFLYSDKESYHLQSYYALDYLKHKLAISLNHKVYKQLGASWTLQWNSRTGKYTAYPENIEKAYTPFALINLRLYADFMRIMTFIDIHNLSNERYVDIGNIEQPGRWISIGLRYSMDASQR